MPRAAMRPHPPDRGGRGRDGNGSPAGPRASPPGQDWRRQGRRRRGRRRKRASGAGGRIRPASAFPRPAPAPCIAPQERRLGGRAARVTGGGVPAESGGESTGRGPAQLRIMDRTGADAGAASTRAQSAGLTRRGCPSMR